MLIVDKVGETEVPVVAFVVVVVVVRKELKLLEDDDVTNEVVEIKVECAAVVLPSAVVTLATGVLVDSDVVDFKNGGPGVELEMTEESLIKNSVVEVSGTVVVVILTDGTLDVDDVVTALVMVALVMGIDVVISHRESFVSWSILQPVDGL